MPKTFARGLTAALTLACLGALVPAAHAAPSLSEELECAPYPSEGGKQEICSGRVSSFDGTKLDVDITKPLNDDGSKRHPLIVMLNGFGNTKHEWESLTDEADGHDKWHWNSHWFAKHGYYVLTYTPRGFCHRAPDPPAPCQRAEQHAAWQPHTPEFSSVDEPYGTIHVKNREVEIRDTQWLAALTAAGFSDIDPQQLAVTGGSYGGGESWLQASQSRWTFPREQDQSLPALDLQVAVPKYPWTDQAYSLAPNGHGGGESLEDPYESSTGSPESDTGSGNPIGTLKESYVAGLYASGNARGVFENGTTTPLNSEGPVSIAAWVTRAFAGDPYDAGGVDDPVVAQIRRGLTEYRASYYQDEGWEAQESGRKVGIFSISGWTDDLFEAVESFRQFKYLKRLDPRWPVEVEVADVGHSRAQNKAETWRRLNAQAFQFVQSQIRGSHEQETTVESEPTMCPNDGDRDRNLTAADRLTAKTPEDLANGTLTVDYERPGETTHDSGLADPNGPRTDPVLGGVFDPVIGPSHGCREAVGPALGGYTAYSAPLPRRAIYVGLGKVTVPYVMTGGTTATVHARVWDDPPGDDAKPILMTRGTYRINVPRDGQAGVMEMPLWGNHWLLDPGHRLRLDVTQVDHPTFRPSNVPTTLTFKGPELTLPTRESGDVVLPGS